MQKNTPLSGIVVGSIIIGISLFIAVSTRSSHNAKITDRVSYTKDVAEVFYLKNGKYAQTLSELFPNGFSTLLGYEPEIKYEIINDSKDCKVTGTLWLHDSVVTQCSQ